MNNKTSSNLWTKTAKVNLVLSALALIIFPIGVVHILGTIGELPTGEYIFLSLFVIFWIELALYGSIIISSTIYILEKYGLGLEFEESDSFIEYFDVVTAQAELSDWDTQLVTLIRKPLSALQKVEVRIEEKIRKNVPNYETKVAKIEVMIDISLVIICSVFVMMWVSTIVNGRVLEAPYIVLFMTLFILGVSLLALFITASDYVEYLTVKYELEVDVEDFDSTIEYVEAITNRAELSEREARLVTIIDKLYSSL